MNLSIDFNIKKNNIQNQNKTLPKNKQTRTHTQKPHTQTKKTQNIKKKAPQSSLLLAPKKLKPKCKKQDTQLKESFTLI